MRIALFFLLSFTGIATAQEAEVSGLVTFVAGPTLYASLGRKDGVIDSAQSIIRAGSDTVAILRLAALSSRSSSWTILRRTRDLRVKDTIVVSIASSGESPAAARDTVRSALALPADFGNRMTQRYGQTPAVSIHGRFSLQYYGIQFEDRLQSMAQPALGFSLSAAARDVPLQVTVYGVHRQRARGSLSPFDGTSRPETRLYRVSAEYDDGTTMLLAGRISPMSSLPMSVVDGFSAARRFGNFAAGIAGGAEPTLTFSLRQKRLWKGMAFLGYQADTPFPWGGGIIYTRSYIRTALVRETASFSFALYAPSGFSINGYSDIDLRQPLSKTDSGDPSLTSVRILGSARIHSSVSVFAGIDGARPVPAPTDYGIIADTLFNRTMRSGLTAGTSVFFRSWSWNLTLSPRMGPGTFAQEYAASTSVGTRDLLSSGTGIQATANFNTNALTTYSSYGLQTRRSDFGLDWRLRFQYYGSSIRQLNTRREGSVVGFDIVALLSQSVSFMATFDSWRGATFMNVLFVDVSWRF